MYQISPSSWMLMMMTFLFTFLSLMNKLMNFEMKLIFKNKKMKI